MNKPLTNGHQHPTQLFLDKAIEYFNNQNFQVALGPEIETEWYNFDFLRVPADHPARDVQDTFWLKDGRVLRTHTTTLQGRVSKEWNIAPPLRVIAPGRVYRNEATDASHEAVFYQLDGYVIDKNINMGHLKSVLEEFINEMFGPVKIKYYPHHYRFVEPAMDVSIWWNNKWLEVLGCGMIHPEVLSHMGLDPKEWQGFAFGMGFDRLTMLKFGISDVRLLYHPDLRLINQF